MKHVSITGQRYLKFALSSPWR